MPADRRTRSRVYTILAIAIAGVTLLVTQGLSLIFSRYFFHPFLTIPVPRGSVVFYGYRESETARAHFYRIDHIQVASGRTGRIAYFYGEEHLGGPYPLFYDGAALLYCRAPNLVVYSLALSTGEVRRAFPRGEHDLFSSYCVVRGKLVTEESPEIHKIVLEEDRTAEQSAVLLCGCGLDSVYLDIEEWPRPTPHAPFRLVKLDLADGSVHEILSSQERDFFLRGVLQDPEEMLYSRSGRLYLQTPAGTQSWASDGWSEWFLGKKYLYTYLDGILRIRDKQTRRVIMSVPTSVPVQGVFEYGLD